MTEIAPCRVRIILSPDNASWIIEKMAHRLAAHAAEFGVSVDIGSTPDPSATINHWMSYAFANEPTGSRTTMTITHLDDPYKIGMVRKLLAAHVDIGICLSSDHARFLATQGMDAARLTFVLPGHDFVAKPRRIVIGLTTRIYKDGRKREHMLVDLAKRMGLSAFRFEIFGSGWEQVIGLLEKAGAEILYDPGTEDYLADYRKIAAALPQFDYYLYLGRDEGSLGTLDALAAGVRTIVTPQGFHCDLAGGITHPIWTQEDLEQVFWQLAAERSQLAAAVAPHSWRAYAAGHCRLWTTLARGERIEVLDLAAPETAPSRQENHWLLMSRSLNPRRIRSAVSHIPLLKPVRRWLLNRMQS